MKKGILWVMVSWLIVLAFVLTSCGPATPPGEQEEEEEEEEEEEVPTLSIGETFQTPGVVVTVSDPIVTDSYEYHDTFSGDVATKEASPGTSFLIFTAEIKNVDMGEDWNVGRELFRIFDSEGFEYRPFPYYGDDSLPLRYAVLQPGEKIGGTVLFNIQEGASGLKIAFSLTAFPLRKAAEWEIE
ncbi:hypothetical protein ES703_33843 [subsurface metagenome]